MKMRPMLLGIVAATTLLSGCQTLDSGGSGSSDSSILNLFPVSDEQVIELSDKACTEMDSKSTIAPTSSEYSQRLRHGQRLYSRLQRTDGHDER
jgi:putative metalloprotease